MLRPPPAPGEGSVKGGCVAVALKLLSLCGISKLDLPPPTVVDLGGSSVGDDPSRDIEELCFNRTPEDDFASPFCICCGGYCDTDEDILALLFTELEKADVREVCCDCVPSVLESSDVLCRLSSKLITGRIVEFMRVGTCNDVELNVVGRVLPWVVVPFVFRDMTELIVPSEARLRVDRCEGTGRSETETLGTFVGVDSEDVILAACAASVVEMTDTVVSFTGEYKSALCSIIRTNAQPIPNPGSVMENKRNLRARGSR